MIGSVLLQRLAITAALALASPALANEPATVLFVLDGSGSMWANLEVERRSKLALTRDAIRSSMALTARDTRIGLVSELREGVIERMLVTPVRRSALLIGRVLANLVALVFQARSSRSCRGRWV